jgi:DNA-binding CsgD family transcriptional regulator
MYSERALLELVGSIYAAASDASHWPFFLEQLAGTLKSKSTTLFVQDLRDQHGSANYNFNVDPAYNKAYSDHFAPKNVYLIRGKHLLKPGGVFRSEQLCPDSEAMGSEFYNDWIQPQDQRYGLLGVLFQERQVTSMLGVIRGRRSSAFSDTDLRLVRALVPHLQRGLQLQHRLRTLEVEHRATAAALDRWSLGVIVIGRDGRILFCNRSAESILNARDGLSSASDGLRATAPQETAALRALIYDAIGAINGRGLGAGGALTLSRPSLKRALNVLVAPALRQNGMLPVANAAAIVFVSDPEPGVATDERVLQKFYGLTPAESVVTSLLIQGKDVTTAAEELSITANTVRIHLKKIFQKTGTRRQAELVRLIMQSPAQLRRPG